VGDKIENSKNQTKEKKKKNFWYWVIIIIVIFLILNAISNQKEKWKEENCDLKFYTYTYSSDCAEDCSYKCNNEGFPYRSSSYFEPILSYEEMINTELYKQCECNCGGCRDR